MTAVIIAGVFAICGVVSLVLSKRALHSATHSLESANAMLAKAITERQAAIAEKKDMLKLLAMTERLLDTSSPPQEGGK